MPEERFDFSQWLRFSSIKLTLKKSEKHTHMHTYQCFWSILYPFFLSWVQTNEKGWENWDAQSLLCSSAQEGQRGAAATLAGLLLIGPEVTGERLPVLHF